MRLWGGVGRRRCLVAKLVRAVSNSPETKAAIAPIHERSEANAESAHSKSTAGVKKSSIPHEPTGTR